LKFLGPRKKLAWCAVILLALPFVLEGVTRVRSYVRYGSNLDVFDLYRRDPETGLRTPIPGLATTLTRAARIEIDSRGFRNPEFEDPKPPRTVRLAFLGASPVFCVEVPSNAETWPQRVRDALAAARPELDFDYLNAAVSAYGVEDSRVRLRHHVRQHAPDVIVIYHATRDLTEDTRALALAAGLAEEKETSWLEEHSLLVELVLLNLRYREAQERGRSAQRKLELDLEPLARRFGERMAALIGEAREVAPCVVVVTFAIRARRDQRPEVQLENLAHAFTFTPYLTPAGILDAYDAYNEAARRAARAAGALVVDGPEALPGTAEYFVDSVHLTARGCEALAGRVAEELLAAAPFLALLERERAEQR